MGIVKLPQNLHFKIEHYRRINTLSQHGGPYTTVQIKQDKGEWRVN